MGMAWAVRKGELARSKVNKEVLDIADSDMSDEDLKHFASTKHKSLKESLLEESLLDDFKDQSTKIAIKKWLEENSYDNLEIEYKINNDLTIDIDNFIYTGRGNFPKFINFRKCKGEFSCDDCEMTSLRGCPQYVGSIFNCSYNFLKTLEGGPKRVDGSYVCRDNELISLKGCAEHVGGNFKCVLNKLRSLKYGPKYVGDKYICIAKNSPETNKISEKEIRETIKKVCKK